MIASTARSSGSPNFSPRPEKTLMPLSPYGLCEAESTTPRSKSKARARQATAGVGMTPAETSEPPAALMPRPSSRSIHGPDSRVSRPRMNRAREPAGRARTSAAPRRAIVGGSSGRCPAAPRIPSVPNRRSGAVTGCAP
jgi:hypothetical protein